MGVGFVDMVKVLSVCEVCVLCVCIIKKNSRVSDRVSCDQVVCLYPTKFNPLYTLERKLVVSTKVR